jgi:hypothetical protein
VSEDSKQPKTLIEELFEKGIMVMGPSRHDPKEIVGTFPPDLFPKLVAQRTAEMQRVRFMAGEWLTVNQVPATPRNPAYAEHGKGSMRMSPTGAWLCLVRSGVEVPHITFDPFSRQWMYILAEGAFGILRSKGWEGERISFTGLMTMIGAERELRHTITKVGGDEFHSLNEELHGSEWVYVDEWQYRRG